VSNVLKFPKPPRSKLDRVFNEHRLRGFSKTDLCVMSPQIEPFLAGETREKRASAEWLAEQVYRFYPNGTCHVRGLHYRCVAVGDLVKPDGDVYRNTDSDWQWLGRAATNARWLGLVPFDRVVDNRNEDPTLVDREQIRELRGSACPSLLDIRFDSETHIAIDPEVEGFEARQPYALAIYGEKSSLKEICAPICQRFDVDLYLPKGEFSLTQAHDMAKRAVADGRPLVLFTLTDCDPQGHNMPTAAARKLHGFKCGIFPSLEYRVIPIALTPKQAGDFGLPSTPIKGKKGPTRRVLKWREAFGRDQTEIDAMIALKEDELQTMIVDAIQPFFDETLRARVQNARDEYEARAREQIEQQVGWRLDAVRSSAESVFGPYNAILATFERRLDSLAREITLPPAEVPQAQLSEPPAVYVDSRWTWKQQTDAMKTRKAFDLDDDEDEAA
jgi:hypothetical protein